MKYQEAAIAAIRTCKTKKELDDMLEQFEIRDAKGTIDFLNKCMYSPQTFDSFAPVSLEDELEFTKQIFLTGTWKLHDYYTRMGITTEKESVSA